MGALSGRDRKIVRLAVTETVRLLGRPVDAAEQARLVAACEKAAQDTVFDPDPIPPTPRPVSATPAPERTG